MGLPRFLFIFYPRFSKRPATILRAQRQNQAHVLFLFIGEISVEIVKDGKKRVLRPCAATSLPLKLCRLPGRPRAPVHLHTPLHSCGCGRRPGLRKRPPQGAAECPDAQVPKKHLSPQKSPKRSSGSLALSILTPAASRSKEKCPLGALEGRAHARVPPGLNRSLPRIREPPVLPRRKILEIDSLGPGNALNPLKDAFFSFQTVSSYGLPRQPQETNLV